MNRYSELDIHGYERVVRCDNAELGFTAWVAIHDTTLGPALGGCRVWNYDDEEEALTDVLRLSRGMTYKNSLAGLDLGGGKSVVRIDPTKIIKASNRESLFLSYGKFVEYLAGSYITAEDVNTTLADMEIVKQQTDHVATVGASGNPSPFTAYGVYCAIRSSVLQRMKRNNLKGLVVAIQGLGETGGRLAKLLAQDGCILIGADLKKENFQKLTGEIEIKEVAVDQIYEQPCDIFSPCALGGILNKETIPQLKCSIVAGSANNQLLNEEDGERLRLRNILYAPDYAINAGGVINISCEIGMSYDAQLAKVKTAEIGNRVRRIFELSRVGGVSTNVVANRMAEERIEQKRGEQLPLLKTA